jgi:hypothetical protein
MNGGIEMGNFFQDIIAKDPQFKSPLRVSSMMLLEPITRVAVLNIVADAAAQGIALMVWETFRSRQRQRVLYDQHATQLHTVGVHHYGLAADVVKDVNGEPSWKGDFTFLVALAKKHGLISGADWGEPGKPHSFVDQVHVQRIAVIHQMRLFSTDWYPGNDYVA